MKITNSEQWMNSAITIIIIVVIITIIKIIENI